MSKEIKFNLAPASVYFKNHLGSFDQYGIHEYGINQRY